MSSLFDVDERPAAQRVLLHSLGVQPTWMCNSSGQNADHVDTVDSMHTTAIVHTTASVTGFLSSFSSLITSCDDSIHFHGAAVLIKQCLHCGSITILGSLTTHSDHSEQ